MFSKTSYGPQNFEQDICLLSYLLSKNCKNGNIVKYLYNLTKGHLPFLHNQLFILYSNTTQNNNYIL